MLATRHERCWVFSWSQFVFPHYPVVTTLKSMKRAFRLFSSGKQHSRQSLVQTQQFAMVRWYQLPYHGASTHPSSLRMHTNHFSSMWTLISYRSYSDCVKKQLVDFCVKKNIYPYVHHLITPPCLYYIYFSSLFFSKIPFLFLHGSLFLKVIQFALRDYIQYWYYTLSEDESFLLEIRQTLQNALVQFSTRCTTNIHLISIIQKKWFF